MAEDNRCGGVYSEGNKNDKGLGTCEKRDTIEYGQY